MPVHKTTDSLQLSLVTYACDLTYSSLGPAVVHVAKTRLIDTLGALVRGFFGEPCRVLRNLAAPSYGSEGATIIGTRFKTGPDLAALVNGTTARYVEMTDVYTWPGSSQGHPSDTLLPLLAVAEYARVDGRNFITSVVLAYEIYQRMCDAFHNLAAFDNTNFVCLATAAAAGKLLGLSANQLSHCIAMAVVPNVILRQARLGHFKAVAAGYAGRAGVFAALLAQAGMEGPHLPFEGKAGWCDHVAKERVSLNALGGIDTPFKILDSRLKPRPAADVTIPAILAAEKVAPLHASDIKQVTVEINKKANDAAATGAHRWNPDSREAADHSVPYVVAATLMDGGLTVASFDEAHLGNAELRALMQKIKVAENAEFTAAWECLPQQHRARVSVVMHDGKRFVGESGGDHGDMSAPLDDRQIEEKFRALTDGILSTRQVISILEPLWHLEDLANVVEIPPCFVFI